MILFGEILKKLRHNKGITQEELANILFVERASVGKWERGLNYPNQNILLEIADFFNVSLDYLFDREIAIIPDNAKVDRPEILEIYDELTPAQQNNLLNYAKGMAVSNALEAESRESKRKKA